MREDGRAGMPGLLLACVAALIACLSLLPARALAASDAPLGFQGRSSSQYGAIDEQEMSQDAIEDRIDAYCAAYAQGESVDGIVMSSGRTVDRYAFGSDDDPDDVGDEVVNWGRCSDLLVWTSVMRLVETGQIDLDEPIRTNLPDAIALPDGYGALTMLDLMNHVTGLNVSASSATSLTADGRSITSIVGRYKVYPAYEIGQYVAYSSYDVVLAAAVIESVTGEDICTYVTDNILTPLGMDDTAVAVGLSPAMMASSSDERAASVAGRFASNGKSASQQDFSIGDFFASLTSSELSTASGAIDGAALTCLGSLDDAATLASTLVSPQLRNGVFASEDTVDELFETTRTYPYLGTRRIAHGLFALPTRPSAAGMVGTASGSTFAIYMDRDERTIAVVRVRRAARTGLAQGVAGAALSQQAPTAGEVAAATGTNDIAAVASGQEEEASLATMTATIDWTGVYQDAATPQHGPSKLLGFLESTIVTERGDVLSIAGGTATSLGQGVYVTAEPAGNDPYRFHVGLVRGAEYSRTMSDSYRVPTATLVVEGCLIVGGALSAAIGLAYVLAGIVGMVRARAARRRWTGQLACLWLSIANVAVFSLTVLALLGGEEVFLAAMPIARTFNAIYLGAAALGILWLAVTRWRGTASAPRQRAMAVACALSTLALCIGLIFWELLP